MLVFRSAFQVNVSVCLSYCAEHCMTRIEGFKLLASTKLYTRSSFVKLPSTFVMLLFM